MALKRVSTSSSASAVVRGLSSESMDAVVVFSDVSSVAKFGAFIADEFQGAYAIFLERDTSVVIDMWKQFKGNDAHDDGNYRTENEVATKQITSIWVI